MRLQERTIEVRKEVGPARLDLLEQRPSLLHTLSQVCPAVVGGLLVFLEGNVVQRLSKRPGELELV